MKRDLYILDFDRTIFDSDRFFQDRLEALRRTYAVDVAKYHATIAKHTDHSSGGHNAHAHAQELVGLKPDEYDAFIQRELAGKDYAYGDAAQWILYQRDRGADLVIVTVGWPRYQQLKFDHCRCVAGLKKVVVPTNKGAIMRHFLEHKSADHALDFLNQDYHSIYLIDDACNTFTALGTSNRITGIRISRAGEKWADEPTPPGIREIHSFEDLMP